MTALNRDSAAAFARLAVANGLGEPHALTSLAQTCRRLGALEEAKKVLDLLPEVQREATPERLALWSVLNERAPPPPASGLAHPTAFVRRLGFLPSPLHAQILWETAASIEKFTSSEINDHAYEGVNFETRRSLVVHDVGRLREMFLPKVLGLIQGEDVVTTLGLPPLDVSKIELQLTCHGNGAFFRPHTDAGSSVNVSRKLSFVYYFNFAPKVFNGGDLIIYDGSLQERRWSRDLYSRIEPADNSIVLFPSLCTHEVETIHLHPAQLAGGRFSLNGWVH